MKQFDTSSEYVGRRMDEIIKIKGKHYKGSLERIVGGALYI